MNFGSEWVSLPSFLASVQDAILSLTSSAWIYLAVWAITVIDGIFPPIPSESVVIAAATAWRLEGKPQIVLIWLVAAFGAWCGDQLAYARFLAGEAHARGLSIGLKNDLEQVGELLTDFDWALDEECMQYGECGLLAPVVAAGKAVFHVEYGDAALAEVICSEAHARGFATLIKHRALDAFRIACP